MKWVIRAISALLRTLGVSAPLDVNSGVKAFDAGDYGRALRIWRPFAEQGDANAQFNLGLLYDYGYGMQKDHAHAVRWYQMAAERGQVEAQFQLGVMYGSSRGVLQNYVEAVRWFRIAAKQGHADAQFHLGVMYAIGRGVPQEYATAHMWFNIAAANGVDDAVQARDATGKEMTGGGISEAQRRARVCMESGYRNCD